MDSTAKTMRDAVIRDETGNLRLHECRPKITNRRATSLHITEFNRKTIGDIQQKHKQRQEMLHMVLGRSV